MRTGEPGSLRFPPAVIFSWPGGDADDGWLSTVGMTGVRTRECPSLPVVTLGFVLYPAAKGSALRDAGLGRDGWRGTGVLPWDRRAEKLPEPKAAEDEGLIRAIHDLEHLPPGWDGEDGRPLPHDVVTQGAKFVRLASPLPRLPKILMGDEGELSLEWTASDRSKRLTVHFAGRKTVIMTFLSLASERGIVKELEFDREIPDELGEALKKID